MALSDKIKAIIEQSKAEKQARERELRAKEERKAQARKEFHKKNLLSRDEEIFTVDELDPAYVAGLSKAVTKDVEVNPVTGKVKLKLKKPAPKHERLERLHKVIARTGLVSVRKAEDLIYDGLVSVNGVRAVIGQQVNVNDKSLKIRVEGEIIDHYRAASQNCRVIIYNKAEGEISTRHDPEGRPTVFDRLPRLTLGRWVQVGRLDANTSGLLLFTTDGELAHRLMHPSYEIERKYICRIYGNVTPEALRNLSRGVKLDDGIAKFTSIRPLSPKIDVDEAGNVITKARTNDWYEVTLKEGKNHEVRRLWESQNLVVSRLIRTEYAGIALSRELSIPVSGYLEADLDEINLLRGLVGLRPETQGYRPGNYGQSNSELKRQKHKQLKTIRGAIRKDMSHRNTSERIYDERTADRREQRKTLVSKIQFENKRKYTRNAAGEEVESFEPEYRAENSKYQRMDRQDNRGGFDRNRSEGRPFNRDSRPDNRGGFDRNRSEGRPFNRDSRPDNRGGFDRNRSESRPFNRDSRPDNRGGFDRNRSEGRPFNRDSRPDNRGGFDRNRSEGRPFNRDSRQDNRGGFDRNRSEGRPFNRDSRPDNRGGFDRNRSEGRPFNRDSRPDNRGGFDRNRSEGRPFNRDSRPDNRGGFDRNRSEGRPFNRDSRPDNRGGFDRNRSEGRPFNRDSRPDNRGGFDRNRSEGRPFNRDSRPDNRGSFDRNRGNSSFNRGSRVAVEKFYK